MYRFLECTVGQYMTHSVKTVTRQVTMHDLEALFEQHDFNAFPVVEQEKVLGVVTKFDFLRAFAFTTGQMVPSYDELMSRPVAEVMTEAVVHVEPTAPLTRLTMMVNLKIRSLPVIDAASQLVGIISREDVMRALKESTEGPLDTSYRRCVFMIPLELPYCLAPPIPLCALGPIACWDLAEDEVIQRAYLGTRRATVW
jgi:CBS domain-containing protein